MAPINTAAHPREALLTTALVAFDVPFLQVIHGYQTALARTHLDWVVGAAMAAAR